MKLHYLITVSTCASSAFAGALPGRVERQYVLLNALARQETKPDIRSYDTDIGNLLQLSDASVPLFTALPRVALHSDTGEYDLAIEAYTKVNMAMVEANGPINTPANSDSRGTCTSMLAWIDDFVRLLKAVKSRESSITQVKLHNDMLVRLEVSQDIFPKYGNKMARYFLDKKQGCDVLKMRESIYNAESSLDMLIGSFRIHSPPN